MKMTIGLFGLLSIVACTLAQNQSDRPSHIECVSDADCKPEQCCVISQQRYSIPSCQPRRAKGDVCRPGGSLLVSGPRYYPDFILQLKNVHHILCPCASDLVCNRTDGECHNA